MIALKKLSATEFARFRKTTIEDYAKQSVRAGRISEGKSLAWASKKMEKLLPQKEQTEDHFLYKILNTNINEMIGYLWMYGESSINPRLFLYDLYLSEAYRGKGLGKQTMLALEKLAKSMGFTEIELHVFAWNKRAVRLYKSLGFIAQAFILCKKI